MFGENVVDMAALVTVHDDEPGFTVLGTFPAIGRNDMFDAADLAAWTLWIGIAHGVLPIS